MDVGLETSLGDRTTSVVPRICKSSKAHSHALTKAYHESFENLLLCPGHRRTDHLYICSAVVLTLRNVEMRPRLQQSDDLKSNTKMLFVENCQGEGTLTC